MLLRDLAKLDRPAIQRFAKRHGVKANSKTTVIIEALLKKFPEGIAEPSTGESSRDGKRKTRAVVEPPMANVPTSIEDDEHEEVLMRLSKRRKVSQRMVPPAPSKPTHTKPSSRPHRGRTSRPSPRDTVILSPDLQQYHEGDVADDIKKIHEYIEKLHETKEEIEEYEMALREANRSLQALKDEYCEILKLRTELENYVASMKGDPLKYPYGKEFESIEKES